MKVAKQAVLVVGCMLAVTAAVAWASDPFAVTVPSDAMVKAHGPSRAEVVADLQIWRLAGLEDLTRPDSFDATSDEYMRAYGRYMMLRKSDQFKALVKRLEQDPSTKVVAAH